MSEESAHEFSEHWEIRKRRRYLIALVLGISVIGMAVVLGLVPSFGEPELVPVTGRILYQGKPLPDGFVISSPVRGGIPALSALNPDGDFELTTNGINGAQVGIHRLAVRAYSREMPPTPIVPAIYISAETSPLTIEIKSGKRNHFEFELDQRSVNKH